MRPFRRPTDFCWICCPPINAPFTTVVWPPSPKHGGRHERRSEHTPCPRRPPFRIRALRRDHYRRARKHLDRLRAGRSQDRLCHDPQPTRERKTTMTAATSTAGTVMHGDCIDLMRKMTTESVDFLLTDPPYITRYRPHKNNAGQTVTNDDNGDWLQPAFSEMFRL